ncbi:endonuclease [Enterococcus phage BUCT630]
MKESKFSREVVKYLKKKGALVNVNTANMFDKVGRSDIECCYKGYWISLELKVGNYTADKLQISYLQKVRDAGGFGLILRDTIQELMVLLSCIDNGIERQYKQPELPEINIEEIVFD